MVTWILCRLLAPKTFIKKTRPEQLEFALLCMCQVHHVVTSLSAFRTMFHSCGLRNFVTGEETCWRTYRPLYSHTLMLTYGHFMFDLVLNLTMIHDFSPLGK